MCNVLAVFGPFSGVWPVCFGSEIGLAAATPPVLFSPALMQDVITRLRADLRFHFLDSTPSGGILEWRGRQGKDHDCAREQDHEDMNLADRALNPPRSARRECRLRFAHKRFEHECALLSRRHNKTARPNEAPMTADDAPMTADDAEACAGEHRGLRSSSGASKPRLVRSA
jgi:hypothetical protein